MSAVTASRLPLAVRIRNARYDGMITGWLHGPPKFQKGDPGGFKSASFTVDQRLGVRSDIFLPYSRCYIYDKRTGLTVFEGDLSHPGHMNADEGPLFEIQVDGPGTDEGVLGDWSNSRIFIDRDLEAWKKTSTASPPTQIDVGEDLGGGGSDALNCTFPNETHVETNSRTEAIYDRVREAGQVLGYFNYAWDCGMIGWTVRSIGSPPSTVIRSQASSTSGSGGSGAVWGGSIVDGMNVAYLQFIWFGGSSNTGTPDTAWTSFIIVIVQAKLFKKDGGFRVAGDYNDTLNAVAVVEDLLGDPLATAFDGTNARVDLGADYRIRHLAYPDSVTAPQVLEDLMLMEPACTYYCGPSQQGVSNLYSFQWIERSAAVRYEAMLWVDAQTSGTQKVDQYNRAVARWRTPIGNLRISVATQAIPEMDGVGRTRTFFQDLSNTVGESVNADQANASILTQHRYPNNTGQVTIDREILDLQTGRYVQPYEIEPGYMIRLVGIDESPDALNTSAPDGGTTCRIVNTDYDGNAVTLDLDGVPLSMLKAIQSTKKNLPPKTRRV